MDRRSIPNLLTALRIVLGIAVFFALAGAVGGQRPWLIHAAFIAYAGGALTDFFDGWLARKWQVTSVWGAILDPIADKIAVAAAVLGLLLLEPRLGLALPGFVILCRELFVSGLREVAAGRGVRFPVTQLAKWKTTLQLVALSLAILGVATGPAVRTAADVLLWIAAALTLWTGWGYASAARAQLKD